LSSIGGQRAKKFDKAMNLANGDVGGDRVLPIKGVVTS